MIDGYPQIEMIGIKIHQLSIQTSVISRHLGLPLQGNLDGYSKAFLDLGHLHLKIKSCFSQILLGHFEPNFVYM